MFVIRLIHKIYMWQFMTSVIRGNPSFRCFFPSNAGQSLAEAIGQFERCEAPRVLVKLSVLELLNEDLVTFNPNPCVTSLPF